MEVSILVSFDCENPPTCDIVFDIDGVVQSNNLVSVILLGVISYIIMGRSWNDWIHENELVDVTIETDFVKLNDLVNQIPLYKNINEQMWHDLSKLWIPCEQLANHLLTRLGWPLDKRQPTKTAIELLNEYSNGYYSEMIQSLKNRNNVD